MSIAFGILVFSVPQFHVSRQTAEDNCGKKTYKNYQGIECVCIVFFRFLHCQTTHSLTHFQLTSKNNTRKALHFQQQYARIHCCSHDMCCSNPDRICCSQSHMCSRSSCADFIAGYLFYSWTFVRRDKYAVSVWRLTTTRKSLLLAFGMRQLIKSKPAVEATTQISCDLFSFIYRSTECAQPDVQTSEFKV